MTRLEAHGRFALFSESDRAFLPGWETDPHFPAVATALADVSGWLEDCADADDLQAAAEQGESLFATGVVEGDVIGEIAHEVIEEVMRWCEAQGVTCSQES